jgi:cytochrome P450
MTIPSLAIDPFAEEFLANPYEYHGALRDAGAVVWLDPLGAYAMARHDEVQAALRDHLTFVSGRGVGLSDLAREEPWRPPSLLLEADPPLHDRTRGLMNRVASLKSLKSILPMWREKAAALVDGLIDLQHFDAVTDLAEAFPLAVFPDLIGLPDEGREHLIPYGTIVFNAFGPRNRLLAEAMEKGQAATAWVAEACKRENLKPDGWGAQVYEAADAELCTQAEAERLVRSFLTAGVDTTVNGIANMIYAFAKSPEEWARMRMDRGLIKRAFDESLRWGGTVQTFFRTTSCDVSVGNETIPSDSKVVLFLAAANRDPRRWEDPERFDVRRATSGHVGFGFGIHQCLGQMVARMEAEALLEALVDRVATIRLDGEPVPRLNNTLRALASLPIAITAA